ncbi:hypothetical protein KIPB_008447, partial [Kipferlia bialata]|eukprot:g8447.t1
MEGLVPQTDICLSIDSDLILIDGEEARVQQEYLDENSRTRSVSVETGVETAAGGKILRNQFNFCHRGTQCFTAKPRDRCVVTDPPRSGMARGSFSPSLIHDAYQAKTKQREEGIVKKPRRQDTKNQKISLDYPVCDLVTSAQAVDQSVNSRLLVGLGLVERMVAENTNAEILRDYRYWEDPSDQFKEGKGSLLPLWSFSVAETKGKTVTCMDWHPTYEDLFAAGYGTYQFQASTTSSGSHIALFSLKNPYHPEILIPVHTHVQSIAWHPARLDCLVAGFYDGTVAVFEVSPLSRVSQEDQALTRGRGGASHTQDKEREGHHAASSGLGYRLIAKSTAASGKHVAPVWSVKWARTDIGRGMVFYSASGDGTVCSWHVVKGLLKLGSVLQLKEEGSNEDGSAITSSATCLVFNPTPGLGWMYAVGTDNGLIRLCSTAYNDSYLHTYHPHSLSIYAL